MALSVVATSPVSISNVVGTTGVAVTHGFSLQNGDILYAFCARGDDIGSVYASSSGGTWTSIAWRRDTIGNDRAAGVLRRVVTDAGGEPSSYTFTIDDSGSAPQAAVVIQVRGGDTTTPEDVAVTVGSDGSSNPNQPDITTVTAGCLIFALHMSSSLNNPIAAGTAGPPSGFTLLEDSFSEGSSVTGGPFRIFIAAAYKAQSSAGLETIGVWTHSGLAGGDEYIVYTVAVRPGAEVASSVYPKIISIY